MPAETCASVQSNRLAFVLKSKIIIPAYAANPIPNNAQATQRFLITSPTFQKVSCRESYGSACHNANSSSDTRRDPARQKVRAQKWYR
jgi:hypothetical protein